MDDNEAIIHGRYKIDTDGYLGKGSFGWIYKAVDVKTNTPVAIKFEKKKSPHHFLEYEARLLRELKGGTGFPTLYLYGEYGEHNILIMDCLGHNLEQQLLNKS